MAMNRKIWYNILSAIPTSDVIEKFNALIQPFFDQKLSNEAEIKKLENLKDLLLSRLVN